MDIMEREHCVYYSTEATAKKGQKSGGHNEG